MDRVKAILFPLVLRSRGLQADLDIWRLYHVIHYYELCGGREVRVPMPPTVSTRKQRQRVSACITKQLIASLSVLSTADNKGDRSFNLRVKTTSGKIPGVHLEGCVVPGTALCFFPGTVYQPSQLSRLSESLMPPSEYLYLMSRIDGCVVDGSEYHPGSEKLEKNPFAVGHLLRHPNTGDEWNVLPYSYTLPSDFPQNIVSWIPNKYFSSPSLFQTKRLKTIVFVAAKHIKNEELFLNYRLNPKSEAPSWYKPVSREENARRWN